MKTAFYLCLIAALAITNVAATETGSLNMLQKSTSKNALKTANKAKTASKSKSKAKEDDDKKEDDKKKDDDEPCDDEEDADCHPKCQWQCDAPVCNQICEPICEMPSCSTRCQELECSVCEIKCGAPECEVRCPTDQCESGDCPECATTCSDPICHTECENPSPTCESICEEPACDWECRRPDDCPKPKCALVCETDSGCKSGDDDDKETSSHVKTVLPDNLTIDVNTKSPKIKDEDEASETAKEALLLHCKAQCEGMKASKKDACITYCEDLGDL